MEDAFHSAPAYLGAYRARLNANLAFWDGLDGNRRLARRRERRPPADRAACSPTTWSSTSASRTRSRGRSWRSSGPPWPGAAHGTCGGRALNDDVMDTFFTLLVNAGNGPVIRDGVDQATRPASRVFPYLAPPNPEPPQPPEHV